MRNDRVSEFVKELTSIVGSIEYSLQKRKHVFIELESVLVLVRHVQLSSLRLFCSFGRA